MYQVTRSARSFGAACVCPGMGERPVEYDVEARALSLRSPARVSRDGISGLFSVFEVVYHSGIVLYGA